MLTVERVQGAATQAEIDALARLRIEVFREYPYLYAGSLAYEQRYLLAFSHCPRSTLVIARDGERVVGAATAMPLLEHGDARSLARPLHAAGIDPSGLYYLGESVLLPRYRGLGVGHAFFDHREQAAREHGYARCAFCAVERPPDHPERPLSYRGHDAFWRGRGYGRRDDLITELSWPDLGQDHESVKPMVFWLKELA